MLFYFKIYFCDAKLNLSAITPVFSVTWSYIIHSNMLIYYQETVLKMYFFQIFFDY